MISKNKKTLNKLNAITDGVIVFISYLLSGWLWLVIIRDTPNNVALINSIHDTTLYVAVAYAFFTVLLLNFLKVYHTSRVHRETWKYGMVLIGNTISMLAVGFSLYLFRVEDFSRGTLFLCYISSCLLMMGKRVIVYLILRHFRSKGYNKKHILVVGGGHLAEQYIKCAAAEPNLGLQIDDHLIPGNNQKMLEDLEAKLHGTGIDEVILALDVNEIDITYSVIQVCEKSGTKISVVPFYNDIIPTHPAVDIVGSVKLIRLRTTPLDEPFNAFVKHTFDIVFSGTLLLLLSPILLIIGIATLLSSPGPILFHQKRIGLNKKEFTMLKFRSMRVNSEQDRAWSGKVDDRRTKIGAILRKTSLDELPQLWNVLIGDMSIVGPRPEIPFYTEEFRETVPLYMVKYQVRPGITGWAQVHGLRGDTSIPDRVKHDLWYIENWSLGLDIKILFKTVFGSMINDEKLK